MSEHSGSADGAEKRGSSPAMRRTLPVVAVLAGLLLSSANAGAAGGAGYNGPTRTLEAAFKIALLERKASDDGCYLAPGATAKAIQSQGGIKSGVAPNFGAIRRRGVVFVISQGANCAQLRMGLLAKAGLYILNAATGQLELKGDKPPPPVGGEGPLRALSMTSKTFKLTEADEVQRLTVLCPGKKYPMGGGMINIPPPGPDGEGIYPHSFERLGVQRGWHINPVMIDPNTTQTTPRNVTVQVVCGKGLIPTSAPHKTVFVKPGETRTATARCPKGSVLLSGGFQRTNFRTPSGNYPTESRAVGTRAWRVSGSAFGADGGELTSIAYCDRSKRPILTEVSSASFAVPSLALGTATTPSCPKGRTMTSGGFSTNGSKNAFFASAFFNPDGTWSAQAFGYFGPVPSLTAYGYCMRPGT